MTKADYTYEINETELKIIDLNKGNMSVTNDAEAVITEISRSHNLNGKKISYQDSDGEWCGLVPYWFNGDCVKVIFEPINYE